jgi:hypothetical protein
VRDICGVVTRCCGCLSRREAGVPAAGRRQQTSGEHSAGKTAARPGCCWSTYRDTRHYAGAHLPVVRDSIHDPRELASTLKFAPRSILRARHDVGICAGALGGPGTSPSCVSSSPQNPHKSGAAEWFPTESPRTIRHSPAHGGTDANMPFTTPDRPLCRQCGASDLETSRGPGGYRPSEKRKVGGSTPPLTTPSGAQYTPLTCKSSRKRGTFENACARLPS